MKPSPNVSLSKLKLHLAEATLERNCLQDESKVYGAFSASQLNVIDQQEDALKDRLDGFSDDYLQRAKIKRLKLDKHKAWKKRRNERRKVERQERMASQALPSTQDQSNIICIPSPSQHESKDKEPKSQGEEKQKKQTMQQQQRFQQLTIVVQKLMHIRDLRRSKLEAKGHFFPETGDAFYNKIKSSVSSTTAEHHTKDDDSNEQQVDNQRSIQPHPQDHWNNQPLDMDVYGYWLQGWASVDRLRRIRQQWDEYLVDNETPTSIGMTSASKIPPTMVSPSLPSSHLWASYLE